MQPRRVHYSDDGDSSPQFSSSMRYQHRSRRASFDQVPSTKQDEIENPNNFTLSNQQKQLQLPIYTSNSTDTSADGDTSILIAPSSVDSINDSTKTPSGSSLLTGFLLHLNSLLPEYCQHLADISTNTTNCTNCASKAVDVLERGSKTLSARFSNNKDMSNSSSKSSTPPQASPILNKGSTSEPSSPSYLGDKTSPKSTSPSDLRTWISSKSPLSPLSPRISQSNRRSLSPSKRNRSSSRNKQRRKELSPSLMKVEWERFIDAFISLAGAECFYSRLDHVLDPSMLNDSSSEIEKGKKTKGVKFDKKESSSTVSQASPTDANKRGSRRLISSYRQIKEDLHIVGEYLVDPVIGKSSTATSPTSSPNKNTSPIKQAAVELRDKLDALICFIDARCALIQVHAELCCPLGSNLSIKVGSNKWMALAEQCHLAMIPIKAKEEDPCTKRIMLNTDKELRALELFLASVDSLLQCNFFDCVVNIRKLHVHLGRNSHQTCLPIRLIRSSLPRLFAMMHIYFNKIDDIHQPLPAVSPLSKRRSFDKVEKGETSNQSKENIKILFDEFIDNNRNRSPPLALGLVHMNRAVEVDLLSEKQQSSEEEKRPEDSSRWEILYMKTTLTTTHPSRRDTLTKRRWPHSHWEDVEKVLTKHSLSGSTDPLKYNNIPSSFITSCHISSITDSVCLIVIQGIDHHAKRQRTSDDDIKLIMRRIHSELSPQNILSVKSVIHVKSELLNSRDVDKQKGGHSSNNKIVPTQSLWSDTAVSEEQRKKILQNALRKKNSPVIAAPLKSPYIKRKLRQNRKKTRKNSINNGHLDLFLGPELSRMA